LTAARDRETMSALQINMLSIHTYKTKQSSPVCII